MKNIFLKLLATTLGVYVLVTPYSIFASQKSRIEKMPIFSLNKHQNLKSISPLYIGGDELAKLYKTHERFEQEVRYIKSEPASTLFHIRAYDASNREMGYISYNCYAHSNPFINKIFVDHLSRKKGIATKLIEKAVCDIRAKAVAQDIYFLAAPFGENSMSLDDLISFYKKRGAIVVSRRKPVGMKFPALKNKPNDTVK